jgi:hypothetical protein
MKYLLALSLLVAAALGASRGDTFGGSASPLAGGSVPARYGDPPWLANDWPGPVEGLTADEAGDPHAGLYGDGDPHAGLYGDGDPHAGLYADDDPHAASDATLDEACGSCPIDGMAAWDGADDGLEATDGDPHATSLGRTALLEAGLEPRVVVPSTAANGHSIAEIHARRTSLAEHSIRVRGTVIKRTDGILGKSYVHLWDGNAGPETSADDLTITTTDEFQIGETVEVEGRLLVDRDLGLGYRYTALLEAAMRVAAN